ncbi:MAG: hypothetical protein EOR68_02830 [Mesorhizobium sp.]|uniref:hypothetical protein n=1 Tax=Mesorhizobium sp. TaxID=1871066 RepID=UPI000FE6D7C0|nr:hypothetical protein [Mesorhizobium sp.]RWM04562.1 MAG: hypothetical protein EOR68_02830 [Mesorhizobium sp.]
MTAHVRTLKPFGCPKGMDPRTWRQTIEKELNALFDKATALITALDVMDADSEDYEDGADDEPSLGWTERGGQSFLAATAPHGSPCDTVDLELDNCDDEDGHDAEPCPDDAGETVTWESDKSQEVLVSL